MKKLFLIIALVAGIASVSSASEKYKLDENSVDQLFSQSSDITFLASSDFDMNSATNATSSLAKGSSTQTKGGFILRAIFCGWIGLHRSYMGGKNLWWKYLLGNFIPVVNGLQNIDCMIVLLGPPCILNKYKNNNKWFVVLDCK